MPAPRGESEAQHAGRPFGDHFELGSLPGAVPSARLHALHLLLENGFEQAFADVVELIVSELVTNAVQASKGILWSWFDGRLVPGTPPVHLWLESSDGSAVGVSVWDANQHMPVVQKPDLEKESGRGLLLVEALTERWWAVRRDGSSGKTIHATLRAP